VFAQRCGTSVEGRSPRCSEAETPTSVACARSFRVRRIHCAWSALVSSGHLTRTSQAFISPTAHHVAEGSGPDGAADRGPEGSRGKHPSGSEVDLALRPVYRFTPGWYPQGYDHVPDSGHGGRMGRDTCWFGRRCGHAQNRSA